MNEMRTWLGLSAPLALLLASGCSSSGGGPTIDAFIQPADSSPAEAAPPDAPIADVAGSVDARQRGEITKPTDGRAEGAIVRDAGRNLDAAAEAARREAPHPDMAKIDSAHADATTAHPDAMATDAGTICDIFLQNCLAGQKCVPTGVDSTKHVTYGCIAAGATGAGGSCTSTAGGDNCAQGTVCLPSGSGGSVCFSLCGKCDPSVATGADPCPNPMTSTYCMPSASTPTYCVDIEIATSASYPIALLCVQSCNIYSSSGCTYVDSSGATQTNGACFYLPGGPACDAPGTIPTGSACAYYNDCVAGDSCFYNGTSYLCLPNCNTSTSSCSGTTTCHADSSYDSDVPLLGYCQ